MITFTHKALSWIEWPTVASSSSSPPALRGLENAADLATRSIVVCGLGAVGGVVLESMARLGVGNLVGVDPDYYGELSRATQPMSAADVGQPKARVQGERAHAANPQVHVRTALGFAQDLPLRLLRQADLLVSAGDNLDLLVWAGVRAAALGKPLVQGAVHGESWTAIVRAFELRRPDAACPACMLGRHDWSRLNSRAGCDPGSRPLPGPVPTRTLPTVCATAGLLVAGELVKWLTGLEEQALRGQELTLCLRTHRVWRTDLPRSATCRCPHEHWRVEDVDRGPSETTPARLARQAGLSLRGSQMRAEVPWVRFAGCEACGRQQPVRRFARLGESVGRCTCGAALLAAPLGICSVLPAEDLLSCQDTPLDALGLTADDAVGLCGESEWIYFVFPDALTEPSAAEPERGAKS